MSAAEYQRIAATESAVRERIIKANEPKQRHEPRGPAEIIPFPSNRCRHLIDLELVSVRDYAPDAAYRHLNAVVRKHRSRLRALGVDPKRIEVDADALEQAFGLRG